MSPTVFTLVVLSATVHALWNLLIKGASDKQLMTVAVAMFAGIAGFLALPFFPVPDRASWPFVAASGLVSVAYFLMLAATYRVADMSLAYPVIRGSSPLLVAFAGLALFREYLPAAAWVAIFIISGGILSMAMVKHKHGRHGLGLAMGTAVLTAATTLIDAEGARRSQSPASYTLYIFAMTGVLMTMWVAVARRGEFPDFIKQNWHLALPAGVGAVCSYGTALWAMTIAPVAMVAALRETTVLFGTVLAWLVLKEQIGRSRLAAIISIAVGAAILRAA